MTDVQQRRYQKQRRMWVLLLITAAMIEIVSCIPSTESLVAEISCQVTTMPARKIATSFACSQSGRQKRPQRTIGYRLKSLSGADELSIHDRIGDEPSCVLKERNPYDVHVYYGNADQKSASMELRQKMHATFGEWMRFYSPKDRPIGPHPLPMWEADFGGYEHRHKWTAVRDFLLDNNPEKLSILIHPHSVDGDYADHTEHAFWAGEVLELRIQGWRR